MIKFLGRLFGSTEAANDLIETTGKVLDEAFYTKQEQAEDRAKDVSEARRMIVDWLAATSGQNLSRRILALTIAGTWILLNLVGAGLGAAAIWVTDKVMIANLLATQSLLSAQAAMFADPVMLILGFYFAAPYMGKLANTVVENWSNKSKNNQT